MTQLEEDAIHDARAASIDMKPEVVVIPVSDVDRAKKCYGRLGWRLNAASTAPTKGASAQNDANWPERYAAYIIAKQAGQKLPQGATDDRLLITERYL